MLKTYYTFSAPPDLNTYHPRGHYHWMELPSGGYVCVLDSGAEPAPGWAALPHLLDHIAGAGLKDFGCVPTDTMFQAAKKLAVANRFFHP